MMAIPADAPHPENAYKFINYILQPEVEAGITNAVFYANPVPSSIKLVDPAISGDPGIYPSADVQSKMHGLLTHSQDFTQQLTRAWTTIKTGE